MKKLIFVCLLTFMLMKPAYSQFKLHSLSGDITAGKTYILLTWTFDRDVAGYNLYRKQSETAAYPVQSINSKPLAALADCNEIKAIIPTTSEEWKQLVLILTKTGTMKMPDGSTTTVKQVFDPCNIAAITPKDTSQFQKLQALAHLYPKIAQVIGQAYMDNRVTVGTTYWYQIRGVDKNGTEIGVLATDMKVTAGTPTPVPAPKVSTGAGDGKILLLWDQMAEAIGFDIERKSASQPAVQINESKTVALVTKTLKGDTLIPARYGFVDFQRWDKAGDPTTHLVKGKPIDGPRNGVTYSYRVRGWDLLNRPGTWSGWINATPQDKTPPAVPKNVQVQAFKDTIQIKWLKVTLDARGHKELSKIKGYQVFRYESADTSVGTPVGTSLVPQPTGTGTSFVFQQDGVALLRPAYGEKSFWYRVQCSDGKGNRSKLSAAVEGHLDDITPPSPPKGLVTTGFEDYIELQWLKNTEPDTAGYLVYRGICGGDTVILYRDQKIYKPYPLHLIATIDDPDSTLYEDRKVPKGSPICYKYAVKAYDKSQNLSDTSRTVCQRLREKTPPPPPVISALKARDRGIRVEWVAPPVQDLFGFVVERSATGNAPWVPVNPALSFHEDFGCNEIPATNTRAANKTFSFVDKSVTPKKTYWYRVKAADYGGNIGKPSAPIETYTFDFGSPPRPEIVAIVADSDSVTCALKVTWKPAFDSKLLGFVVFRSSDNKLYRQVSSMVKGNEFIDEKIVAGNTYWYKIQYFRKDGNRSLVSKPQSGKVE